MTRPIAYDLVRLFLGPFSATPRGVDRVDFGYARHFFEHWPADCVGVLPTPWGIRFFDRELIVKAGMFFDRMWGDAPGADRDLAYERCRAFIIGSVLDPEVMLAPARRRAAKRDGLKKFFAMTGETGWSVGRPIRDLPKDAIYLNIGNWGLVSPLLLSWLRKHPDVSAVFMIHDVIPLTHAEYGPDSWTRSHGQFIDNTVRFADRVIVPSEATRIALQEEFDRRGSRPIPIEPIRLPVNEIFTHPADPDPELAARTYFVACGALEPRKNHLMLLRVWHDLMLKRGGDTPKLVVAGALVWEYEEILAFIAARPGMGDHVIVTNQLSTPGLHKLVTHARALLAPSLAEGFGLPPVEALAVGTPTLLSDIPSHHEGAGNFGRYVDPRDEAAWLEQIEQMIDDDRSYTALRTDVASFMPIHWGDYMERVGAVLNGIGSGVRSSRG